MKPDAYLLSLGITPNYVGFFYAEHGILLAMEDPRRLTLITKQLYPMIAEHFGVTWRAVERAIRTVVNEAWLHGNRVMLEKVLCQTLLEPPTNGRFIGAAAYYLKGKAALPKKKRSEQKDGTEPQNPA